jgi:membrane protease YdiL (CAAX protease family)
VLIPSCFDLQSGPLRRSHLPLFFTVWGAAYQTVGVLLGLLLFLLIVMSYTLVMTWLFNNTGGSLFLAILFHSAIDSKATFFAVC